MNWIARLNIIYVYLKFLHPRIIYLFIHPVHSRMMKLISLALLHFAFLATIFAQNCSLCPDGRSPLNGDLIIFEDFGVATTCNNAVDKVKNVTDEDCRYIFDSGYAFLCGCPRVEAGTCPGLCPDGSNVTSPDLEVDFLGSTCAVLDQLIKGVCNESICAQREYNYPEASTICGCETVQCQACLDSYVSFEFLQVTLSLPDGTVTTCGDFETSIVDLTSTQCSMIQDTILTQCGCPGKSCTLCPGGENPPIDIDSAPNTTELEYACYYANIFTDRIQPNCIDQTETELPYLCGCPNAELPSDAVGCTLCADGNISEPTLAIFNGTYICESLNFVLAVVNQIICDEVCASDEAFLCGCSGVEAPTTPGPFIPATMSPSLMVAINNMGGSGGMGGGGGGMGGMGGGGGGMGGMGGGIQGMGMTTMTSGHQLRSGSLLDIFPPRSSCGFALQAKPIC